MIIEHAKVLSHDLICEGYRLLSLQAPGIAARTRPGQFVHLRVPGNSVLRRPFSIFKANAEGISIMYKLVGSGTRAMTHLQPGNELSIIGPLGNGFPEVQAERFPVLVGGGYGAAALRLLAERSPLKGIIFIGGSRASDILCVDEFQGLEWETRAVTEDGSRGDQGIVTDTLDNWLTSERDGRVPEFFACGPMGMLRAVCERAVKGGWTAWLSMERHMGCGVGACLGCVQKIRARASRPGRSSVEVEDEMEWARVCADGPVFECREIAW